jgi:hypothetical protein
MLLGRSDWLEPFWKAAAADVIGIFRKPFLNHIKRFWKLANKVCANPPIYQQLSKTVLWFRN